MKRIVSLIAILAILYSCNDRLSDDIQKDDLIPVKLSLVGEVVVDEEPLTKGASSNDFVAIQVYQDNSPYAYGIFEDASNLNIYLHSGRNYSFKVVYIKNGKDKLTLLTENSWGYKCYYPSGTYHSIPDGSTKFYYDNNRLASDYYYTSYGTASNVRLSGGVLYYFVSPSEGYYPINPPFEYPSTLYSSFDEIYSTSGGWHLVGYQFNGKMYHANAYHVIGVTNQFIYNEEQWISVGGVSSSCVDIDKYYGEYEFNSVRYDNSISIDMKHLVYSLQCNVTGVSDGTASITIKRGNTTLLQNNDISGEYHSDEQFVSCSDWSGAWQ